VVADACAPAYLARAPPAVMLAYLRSATLLALALLAVVVANACSSALFAPAFLTIMRTRQGRHASALFVEITAVVYHSSLSRSFVARSLQSHVRTLWLLVQESCSESESHERRQGPQTAVH
jgi:hypothetical protein